ncbi:MAG: hypothetical protein R2861_10040 [Desulfobacterales bacterium]
MKQKTPCHGTWISISDHKAYLLHYGSNIAWIVGSLAETESNLKPQLDFSAYDDGDGSRKCAAAWWSVERHLLPCGALMRMKFPKQPMSRSLTRQQTSLADTNQDGIAAGIPCENIPYPSST